MSAIQPARYGPTKGPQPVRDEWPISRDTGGRGPAQANGETRRQSASASVDSGALAVPKMSSTDVPAVAPSVAGVPGRSESPIYRIGVIRDDAPP